MLSDYCFFKNVLLLCLVNTSCISFLSPLTFSLTWEHFCFFSTFVSVHVQEAFLHSDLVLVEFMLESEALENKLDSLHWQHPAAEGRGRINTWLLGCVGRREEETLRRLSNHLFDCFFPTFKPIFCGIKCVQVLIFCEILLLSFQKCCEFITKHNNY